MAKQTTKSAANDIQNLFDPQNYQDVFKTWADMNERFAQVAIEAGTRSTEIASETTREALSNLRDVTQVRDEATDYGKAYSDFVQKQMELFLRSAQSVADVTQKAGTETTELVSHTGEMFGQKLAANAESATQKAGAAMKKAA